MNAGETAPQQPQRVGGVLRPELRFDIADNDVGITGELFGGTKTRLKLRHAAAGLQWILGTDEPPDEIELELSQGQFAGIEVPGMGRIE